MNKFYLGSGDVARAYARGHNHSITHATLDSAIEAARTKIEGGDDTVLIVKIIRVVKRATPPIIVEDVENQ